MAIWLKHQKWMVIALTILVATTLQACGEKIDVRQTETTNGLLYKLHDSEPFSGTVAGVHVYQGFSCVADFKKGVLHGAVNCIYDNGSKAIESHWQEGKRDGAEKYWFTDGKVQRTVEWSAGAPDGIEEHFSPDGALITQVHWANGKKVGSQKLWDLTGKTLLVNIDWNNGLQTGFDNSDMFERNYKDGKLDGRQRYYAIDTNDQASLDAGNTLYTQRQAVQEIGGGTYSATLVKGLYLSKEEQYRDGVRISGTDYPRPSSQQAAAQATPAPTPQPDAENQATAAPQAAAPIPTPTPSPNPQPVPTPDVSGSSTSFSPGFNCAKVTHQPEILICSDRDLAELDVQLNQVYSNALARATNKQQIQADEVNWVKSSRNVCADKTCLVQAYRGRIAALAQ